MRQPWTGGFVLCAASAVLVVGVLSSPAGATVGTITRGQIPNTPGAELRASRYNGPGDGGDEASDLAVSPNGAAVFITGYIAGSGTSDDYATAAYDAATGTKLWGSRYNGPGNSDDEAVAIAVSPDGAAVFVTGQSQGSGSFGDYLTAAYDAATGAKLWNSRYNGPGNSEDGPQAIAVSPDGATVFVTGQSPGSVSTNDYATAAYDAATGAKLWASRYNGPANGDDFASAIAVSPDGAAVFVTGDSRGSTSSLDHATVAYDAATGAKLWASRYNDRHDGDDYAYAIAVSPDGAAVFVTGGSQGSAGFPPVFDYATVAYDAATGAKLWISRYNGPGDSNDFAYAIAVSPDGAAVFVTGGSVGSGTSDDYATAAYDAATGAKLWITRFNGRANGNEGATALAVSPNGGTVFVTGSSEGSGTFYDYATAAYNAATGSKLWISRYTGPGSGADIPLALEASPDNAAVFVTGASAGPGGKYDYDYATVAYSAH